MTITINDKIINLNCWEWLKVKELRVIMPIIKNSKDWEEIDMAIKVVKALSDDPNVEDIINEMDFNEITELQNTIAGLIIPEKKTKA